MRISLRQMKKKRNTRSASKVADIVLGIVCVVGMAYFTWLFVDDLNQTRSRDDEEPVATVTYKNKTVQRRFSNEEIWQKVHEDDLIYEGDRVRTDANSEVQITVLDNNEAKAMITLNENSLMIIRKTKDGLSTDFQKGSVQATALPSSDGKPVVITTGSKKISLDKTCNQA